jgi:SAM-dependent methyltransferase
VRQSRRVAVTHGYACDVACRLNLGAGDEHLDGWVHLDFRSDVSDVVGDAANLPFATGSVAEVRAMDLLEHFPQERTQSVLQEWWRVLEPGGSLTLKVPNMLELARWIVANRRTRLVIRNVYGGHRWGPDGAWDAHHAGWTPDLLCDELISAGFDQLHNDGELNMTVLARRR